MKLSFFFKIFTLHSWGSFLFLPVHAEIKTPITDLLNSPEVKFNGLILITQNNEILYKTSAGYRNYEQKIHIRETDQFLIGSISKQITAVLVLSECDAGRIQLDAPIKKYLSDIKEDWAEKVTIHHLLNHTSGITALDQPLKSIPGEKFAYSNLGYDLLGKILEHVTGCSFEELAKNLFKKCEMSYSTAPGSGTVDELQKIFPDLVSGHSEEEGNPIHLELTQRELEHNPSGGMISTIQDFETIFLL